MISTTRILAALAALLLNVTAAAAQNWNGDWDSSFGQLRLLQNGDRLFGDYQERGVIEGRISPDGRSARAYFVYNDGRWGTVEWTLSGDQMSGHWNWSSNGLPQAGSNAWTATRQARRTSPLKFADQTRPRFPADDAAGRAPFVTWIAFADQNGQGGFDRHAGLSDWYGSYELTNLGLAFQITADIIHYDGMNTAAVDLTLALGPEGGCPLSMHRAFCEELRSHGNAAVLRPRTTGVTLINAGGPGEKIEATFRLPQDRADRVLRLTREATYFAATLHHPERGYDYGGFAQANPHLCETAQCQDDIFADLKRNPARYRGRVDRGAIVRMINLPNRIAASHQTAGPAPAPAPAPQPAPMPRPLLSDAWAILEETSENLGEVTFSPDGPRLAASGKLRGFFETGGDHDTVFTLVSQSDEAVAFDLTVFAGQSGEAKEGRLLIELPSFAARNPRGTLIVGDEVLLVELVQAIPGLAPADLGDTPAIGVFALSYRFRDVPANRSMLLRQDPDRAAGTVGSLPAAARGLQILNCAPQIDALNFTEGDLNRRLALLAGSWCQITDTRIAGWMPGRYLMPE